MAVNIPKASYQAIMIKVSYGGDERTIGRYSPSSIIKLKEMKGVAMDNTGNSGNGDKDSPNIGSATVSDYITDLLDHDNADRSATSTASGNADYDDDIPIASNTLLGASLEQSFEVETLNVKSAGK